MNLNFNSFLKTLILFIVLIVFNEVFIISAEYLTPECNAKSERLDTCLQKKWNVFQETKPMTNEEKCCYLQNGVCAVIHMITDGCITVRTVKTRSEQSLDQMVKDCEKIDKIDDKYCSGLTTNVLDESCDGVKKYMDCLSTSSGDSKAAIAISCAGMGLQSLKCLTKKWSGVKGVNEMCCYSADMNCIQKQTKDICLAAGEPLIKPEDIERQYCKGITDNPKKYCSGVKTNPLDKSCQMVNQFMNCIGGSDTKKGTGSASKDKDNFGSHLNSQPILVFTSILVVLVIRFFI